MSSKKELSIKSRLLFNSLDTNYNIVLEIENKNTKRKKALDTILSTYRMTVKPFIDDEDTEYRNKIYNSLTNKYDSICLMIDTNLSSDNIKKELLPILEHLKLMIQTCKCNMDRLNSLWVL